MLTFSFIMGILGLLLAGDSLGQGLRNEESKRIGIGVLELLMGIYFMVSAIGSA